MLIPIFVIFILLFYLFVSLLITTNKLNSRMDNSDLYIKEYSNDIKYIKNMLRAEVAETVQPKYDFMKHHLPFKEK